MSDDSIKPGYTRISDLLRFYQNFSGIDPKVLNAKGIVGTNVHKAIECFYNNAFCPLTEKEEKYFESFVKWQEYTNIVPYEKEVRFYCDELKITGQVDMLCEFDSHLAIYDFKTSAMKNNRIWELQGAFYYLLAKANKINVSDFYFFIHLKHNGVMADICDFMFTDHLKEICYSMVKIYKHFHNS